MAKIFLIDGANYYISTEELLVPNTVASNVILDVPTVEQ